MKPYNSTLCQRPDPGGDMEILHEWKLEDPSAWFNEVWLHARTPTFLLNKWGWII
jgi:hypothetical protein